MEIKMEDLWIPCDACSGDGKIIRSSGQPGYVGVFETMSEYCEKCRGLGGRMTESGKAVLEFIRILRSKSLFQ
jgi:DnaJ-class molecular chaperone